MKQTYPFAKVFICFLLTPGFGGIIIFMIPFFTSGINPIPLYGLIDWFKGLVGIFLAASFFMLPAGFCLACMMCALKLNRTFFSVIFTGFFGALTAEAQFIFLFDINNHPPELPLLLLRPSILAFPAAMIMALIVLPKNIQLPSSIEESTEKSLTDDENIE